MSTLSAPIIAPAAVPALSIRRNFGWTAAGNAINAACQWGTISALAKLSSAEVVGEYALAMAVTTPILHAGPA